MQRIARKSRNAKEAEAWEMAQYLAMTPEQRIRVARAPKRRAWPAPQPDVREWHRKS